MELEAAFLLVLLAAQTAFECLIQVTPEVHFQIGWGHKTAVTLVALERPLLTVLGSGVESQAAHSGESPWALIAVESCLLAAAEPLVASQVFGTGKVPVTSGAGQGIFPVNLSKVTGSTVILHVTLQLVDVFELLVALWANRLFIQHALALFVVSFEMSA